MKNNMKRITSGILSAAFSAVCIMSSFSSVMTYAEEIPLFYMKPHEAAVSDDGALHISRDDLADGDYTLNIDVYFKDDSKCAWWVAPKIRCASEYIKLTNLVDPTDPPIEYAYATKDEEGNLTAKNAVILSQNDTLNSLNYTFKTPNFNFKPMSVYGEFTDSYPLTSFDAIINSDIPAGEYSVYFIEEDEGLEDITLSNVSMRDENGDSYSSPMSFENITLFIHDKGDVNGDGKTDASDASQILKIYATLSTGGTPEESAAQLEAADADGDGKVDAGDASLILGYYAYLSTQGAISLDDYINGRGESSDSPASTSRSEESSTQVTTTTISVESIEQYITPAVINISEIPTYSENAYVTLNNNIPYFDISDFSADSFEYYSPLDSLERCGVCMACIGTDIMPTEQRGEIGMVKPTGWQLSKYDFVDGKYLYNRCHLIGYQLSGENANVQNLITGTRYLNVTGMLPFENEVAKYVKNTENHVLYRVTPIFVDDNLLCNGVVIEAWSVEDNGEGVCFNVFCYNVQPYVDIDYTNGENKASENAPIVTTVTTITTVPSVTTVSAVTTPAVTSTTTTTKPPVTTTATPQPTTTTTTQTAPPVTETIVIITANVSGNYTGHIYRTKTGKKYHYLNPCGSGTYYECSLEEAQRAGLTHCEKCAY